MISKKLSFIFFLFLFLTFNLPLAKANILINEFQIEPKQAVELWNNSNQIIDLSGWYLDDSGGSTYYTIPANTVIQPKTCLLFFSNFYLNKSSSDTIRLLNNQFPPTNPLAQLIDQRTYQQSPGVDLSWQRLPNASENWIVNASSLGLSNSSLVNCQVTPTVSLLPTSLPTTIASPTSIIQNPTSTIYNIPSNIYLSEVLPNPEEGKEWVELYNDNNFEVVLENWYLDDVEGQGSSPKKFTLIIPPKSYRSIKLSTSIFNNSGDAVRLLNPAQTEKDRVEYSTATKGLSYSRQNFAKENAWCWTQPSQNQTNTSCETSLVAATTSPIISNFIVKPDSTSQVATNQLSNYLTPNFLTISLQTYTKTKPTNNSKVLGAAKSYQLDSQIKKILPFLRLTLYLNLSLCLIASVYLFFWSRSYVKI